MRIDIEIKNGLVNLAKTIMVWAVFVGVVGVTMRAVWTVFKFLG